MRLTQTKQDEDKGGPTKKANDVASARPGAIPGGVTAPQPGDGRGGNPAPTPRKPAPDDVDEPNTDDEQRSRTGPVNRGTAAGRSASE